MTGIMADEIPLTEDLDKDRAPPAGRMTRLAHYLLRIGAVVALAGVAAFAGGFLVFYQHVSTLQPPGAPRADAIVVLTGGYQRIDAAVQLLADGAGKRLLISGVNPATSGNHIRLLTRSTTDLFACCVDIGHDALDTTGNAAETARWIRAHDFHKVILVTNNYHMPRSLAELRRIDSVTDFVPYAVSTPLGPADILQNPMALRTVASEYVKFLLVQGRDWIGAPA